MKHILICGGAGFIGSHLCERLIREGNYVLCLDDFSTGTRDNIEFFADTWYSRWQKHDVREPFGAFGRAVEPVEIYNLACPASPAAYQRDPIGTWETSVLGARNVLELARTTGAKVLQASTSEVYGDPDVSPQPEIYWGRVNPVGQRSCYNEGKRAAESLFMDHHRVHGTRIKIARIFNTYGPRMRADDGRVVSNFITQALAGRPITIYGDGSQTRSFCYVDDMVDGLIRLMATGDEVTGPVNLGNPEEVTIADLANIIGNPVTFDTNPDPMHGAVLFLPLPADDPRRRCPDITLARQLLGWEPRVPLDEGLRRTVEWFRGQG